MNLDMLKGNVGWRVQLAPQAIHLDAFGRELPSKNEDWIIRSVTDEEVSLGEAVILGLEATLGKDHIQSFATNPARSVRGGLQYGYLKLHMQMYVPKDAPIWYQPCVRPGERLPPPPVQVIELVVDFNYPNTSGIQQRLVDDGFNIAWVTTSRVPSLELEGWEVVVEKDGYGRLTSFFLLDPRGRLVFVKKKRR